MNRTEVIQAIAEEIAEEMLEHIEKLEPLTNGEVIKALFPEAEYRICEHDIVQIISDSVGIVCVPLKFWNAPYKGVSE